MLVEFSFSNFRSFKDEAIFSMEPDSQNGDSYNIIDTKLKRIPQLYRSSGIFGANASGKSNIIKAFLFLQFMITNSSKSIIDDEFPNEFYALSKTSQNQPMNFGIKFIIQKTLYDYKFSLSRKIVEQESLYCYDISETGTNKPNRIFEREYVNGKSIFKKSTGILQSWCNEILDNRLFLSDLVNNRKCEIKEIKETYSWVRHNLLVFDTHKISELISLIKIAQDGGNEILGLVKKADLGLDNIKVHQLPIEDVLEKFRNENKKLPPKLIEKISKGETSVWNARSIHKTEDGDTKEFDFENMESDGTKNFLSISGYILDAIKEGKTLIIDEMDDSLHPYLVRYLVDMFNNPEINKNKAQLIFTSHAHYLMDGRHLTRDQIWLTTKDLNNGYSSSLYSLSDLKNKLNRKNISFQEAYLDGIYGAVPNVEML